MLDESQRLRENPHLLSLLSHYAQQGSEDRATWRDRLMQMEGVEPKQLSALHGELIAFDWIEQNTGQASALMDGVLANCYRITLNGLREYGRFHGVKIEEKAPETAEKKGPRFPRKKKQESDLPEAPVVAASEGSPETTETTESPEKKNPKFPKKKKQKSDSPEAPAVATSEESLVPAA
jgi:hypothetical protein